MQQQRASGRGFVCSSKRSPEDAESWCGQFSLLGLRVGWRVSWPQLGPAAVLSDCKGHE